jgi:asparagine synthase (glutamine-hydrolysing)
MCGIVGSWSAHASRTALAAAMDAIAHRGPDGRGEDVDGHVMLGHLRLAILDLSPAGAQPMHSVDGTVTLVYNGEIYNFQVLRDELEARGVVFRGHSDTEVLLELYLADGLAMLPRLNGIFAFALHDRRRGELVLVRDGLGIKPLYYTQGPEGFAFASETKALRALWPDAAWTLDPAAVHRYLTFLWCPGDATPAREVRRLPPGHLMVVREGSIAETRAWYELPARRGVRSDLGVRASVAAVGDALRTAVHRQLVSDVPVGAFLSGGLDSSAVVAFARERVPDLRCFSIETPGGRDAGEVDDLPYARQVASHLGVRLDVVRVEAAQMAADLQEMVARLDEPLADPASLNVLYISRLARESGIKVLLSGAGGDDLFTGYRRHVAAQFERAWSWLPPPMLRGLARWSAAQDQRSARGRRLARLFAHADAGDDARLAGYFAWVDAPALRALYSADMRAAVEGVEADAPMREFLRGIPPGPTRLARLLALEQRFFLADHNLAYTDKMSMAAGVEVRVPFLDNDLVELAARLPDAARQRGREGKWALKQAMAPHLPHDVVFRPKTGFGAPLRRWMRHELRDFVGDVLSEDALRRRGLFDPAAVRALVADNDSGRRDGAYTLLALICIELWCRGNLDRRAPVEA